jgi:hypothetical protein
MGKSSKSSKSDTRLIEATQKQLDQDRLQFKERMSYLEQMNSSQLGLLTQLAQGTRDAQDQQVKSASLAASQAEQQARQGRITQEAALSNANASNNQQIREQQLLSRVQSRQLNQQTAEADKAAGLSSMSQANLISNLLKSRKTSRGIT